MKKYKNTLKTRCLNGHVFDMVNAAGARLCSICYEAYQDQYRMEKDPSLRRQQYAFFAGWDAAGGLDEAEKDKAFQEWRKKQKLRRWRNERV